LPASSKGHHVTNTVQDPVELLRDTLEEQFRRHTGQLSELTMWTRQPDRGGYDEETLIALTVSSRQALADTAAALRRMAEGTYGTCRRCAASIPLERLETVPHTPFCLPCQQTRAG
jgi:RNA polymerase-binding transcription factor